MHLVKRCDTHLENNLSIGIRTYSCGPLYSYLILHNFYIQKRIFRMTIILRQSFSFVGTSRTNRFEYTKQFRVEVGIHIFVGKHFDTVVIGNL